MKRKINGNLRGKLDTKKSIEREEGKKIKGYVLEQKALTHILQTAWKKQ